MLAQNEALATQMRLRQEEGERQRTLVAELRRRIDEMRFKQERLLATLKRCRASGEDTGYRAPKAWA